MKKHALALSLALGATPLFAAGYNFDAAQKGAFDTLKLDAAQFSVKAGSAKIIAHKK